jgi:hypothetical protein
MPEMGLSSAKEAFDVKSFRGIQYLEGQSDGVVESDRERADVEKWCVADKQGSMWMGGPQWTY